MINIDKNDDNYLAVSLNQAEANHENADEFKEDLLQLFAKYQKKIVLNLEQVEYIDSSFLGALVSVLKHLIACNSDIILTGLHKDVANLFKLIRLDKVFKIYKSLGDFLSHSS
jgi:anti-sigma B factor antagonist